MSSQAYESIHKHSISPIVNGEAKSYMLIKDGLPCPCHYVQPAVSQTPSRIGGAAPQIQVSRVVLCSTDCSRANLVRDADKNLFYGQSCCAIKELFPVTNIPEDLR